MKDKINALVNLLGNCIHDLERYMIYCDENVFEPYSVNTAKLYNCLMLDNRATSMIITGQVDVSGPLLYLGNIIEYELNASIGQAMRMILLGIDMPEYYMNYYPCDGIYTVPAGRNTINLNREYENPVNHSRKLAANTIGDLCFAYNDMLHHVNDPILDIIPEELQRIDLNGDYFTYDIVKFGNLRNKAAHAGEVDMDVFDKAFGLYSRIVKDYMPALAELKRRLKTPPEK